MPLHQWPRRTFAFLSQRKGWACLAPILAAALAGCNDGKADFGKEGPQEPPLAVQTAPVAETATERTVVVTGSLAAKDETDLSVKAPGRLESVKVDLGSKVEKGAIIAQVEKRDYELIAQQAEALLAQARARLGLPLHGADDKVDLEKNSTIAEAKAVLDEARQTQERNANLKKLGILAASELETAEAAYKVAYGRYQESLQEVNNRRALLAQRRAEYEIAQQQLADTEIRAPFDGIIQERQGSPGEYMVVGAKVATILRVDPIRLRLEAPERESMKIRLGQMVRMRLEGDTNVYRGTITRVSPALTHDNRMLVVEADVKNDGSLRPGAFARAEIIVDPNAKTLAVPKSALLTFAGVEKVFAAQSGKAVEKRVVTGQDFGNSIEILKGVEKGDIVIQDPGKLRANQAVAVAK